MSLGFLRSLALSGGDWVIDLLLLSSVLAVAVVIERWIVLAREARWLKDLQAKLESKLSASDLENMAKEAAKLPGTAAKILSSGLSYVSHGAAATEERILSAMLEARAVLERRLLILGTLGNNAPFIGLFGTVLGVIKAFHDLSQSTTEGPETVMRGLSEALIATAVGLFVAIPCVVAYNYFQKQVKDVFSGSEALNRLLIARLKSR